MKLSIRGSRIVSQCCFHFYFRAVIECEKGMKLEDERSSLTGSLSPTEDRFLPHMMS